MLEVYTFHVLSQVESTNNYAMEQVKEGNVMPGSAWFSSHQWAGKGQRGRSWVSEPGKNMAMSLALQPGEAFALGNFHFNALVALAFLEGLEALLPREPFAIKWPNDMYWGDRKAGGILTENLIQGGSWRWAITGMGLNVNQESFPGLESKAVSLKSISGKDWNPEDIARQLHEILLAKINAKPDLDELMQELNRHLWKKGEWVQMKYRDELLELRIEAVDSVGRLQTISKQGDIRSFQHGEVEWLV